MAKIRVKGFYAYRGGKRIHVKGHLRKDKGKPGRTPKSKRFGARIEPGALRGWSKDMPKKERRYILLRQVYSDGYATVIRRLGWLVNVSNDRETVAAARADRKYLQSWHSR